MDVSIDVHDLVHDIDDQGNLTQFWVVGHGVLLNTRVITQDKFEGADFQNG